MDPFWEGHGQVLYHADALDMLRSLPDCSVDSVVTDPPYNLEFMGKPWDAYAGQEDAGFCYWLAGLIDGEGCFTIKAHARGTHAPSFALKLRADELGTLTMIRRRTGIGTINREECEPHPMVRWVVQDRAGCQRLCDLLDKYPLRAKKLADYWVWREAVCEWTSRPRGNRWHGQADNTRMAALRTRLMDGRAYNDVAWSGNEFQDWCRLWAAECLRVLKPGGHLVAFGGTRTYHRMVCAIEDAGFEVRDSLHWLYGSGFPKSGTVLKPAHEPIVVARKPLAGTVAQNALVHGTGALNVDGCRVDAPDTPDVAAFAPAAQSRYSGVLNGGKVSDPEPRRTSATSAGRWPPNVLLTHAAGCEPVGTRKVKASVVVNRNNQGDRPKTAGVWGAFADQRTEDQTFGGPDGLETVEAWECAPGCPVAELDRQSGTSKSTGGQASRLSGYGEFGGGSRVTEQRDPGLGDQGGASRFYPNLDWTPAELEFAFAYHAKAAAAERPGRVGDDDEAHPTVKPLALMIWLVKLVTPPRGLVADPFAGTGPTLEAAAMLGMRGIGADNWRVAADSAVVRLSDLGGRDRKIRARRRKTPEAGGTLF